MRRYFFGKPPWQGNGEDNEVGKYDVMQVCLNGHQITASLKSSPEFGKRHCSKCGAATISTCGHCQTDIRGFYSDPHTISTYVPNVPAFCHECGAPYPWTEARLKAAQQLAEELDGLGYEEKQTLKASLDDLVRDTPRTSLAATRFKRLAAKAGKGAAEAFKDILIGVITEAAKKVIWQ
jgi:hypothetical protein